VLQLQQKRDTKADCEGDLLIQTMTGGQAQVAVVLAAAEATALQLQAEAWQQGQLALLQRCVILETQAVSQWALLKIQGGEQQAAAAAAAWTCQQQHWRARQALAR
jgi:hypothetical protein